MKWNRNTDQAIRTLVYLTGKRNPVYSAELARHLGASQNTVIQKNAAPLLSAGLLDVVPGPQGGYVLGKDPAAITLYEVIVQMEGPILYPRLTSHSELDRRVGLLYALLQCATDTIFKGVTIQMVADGGEGSLKRIKKQLLNTMLSSMADLNTEGPENIASQTHSLIRPARDAP